MHACDPTGNGFAIYLRTRFTIYPVRALRRATYQAPEYGFETDTLTTLAQV